MPCVFEEKKGQIVLDQIRTIDKSRLVRKLGRIEEVTREAVTGALAEIFAP
ncbi:MAG: type II toxin-antitoxin system PemK/MazF family toxin [Gemmatimonadetes bacterium]|nr:type II toxin-antitoxin system PemK/MazF family toxin [Gemmatimonadota bacterium]